MIAHTYHDPYSDADVTEYGIGIEQGHRSYGNRADGSPNTDADGNTGKDTVTAVMFGTGEARTFDVDAIDIVGADAKSPPRNL